MRRLVVASIILSFGGSAQAATFVVAPGAPIQAAIDAASDGDRIELAAGEYAGDLRFDGKAVHVVGVGPETVIRGSGTDSVVTFDAGEGPGSVLDSVTVTGGEAPRGGGVRIENGSPTVVRTVISQNAASSEGSGIFVSGLSTPLLYNNLVSYNVHTEGDPHAIQTRSGAAPVIVNNTIVRNDSNGILLSGSGAAIVHNNVIARNGSRAEGGKRGRGICDFSGGTAEIAHNAFHRNRVAALLRDGRDWKKVRRFQERNGDPLVFGNVDGPARFVGKARRRPDRTAVADFAIRDHRRSRARDAGNPAALCNDLDGSPNDMGFTGGPFAPGSTALPDATACGQ